MENRCETIGKYLLPLFRSLVARELVVTYELTQLQASEILGTTQAAISQYLNFKRAIRAVTNLPICYQKFKLQRAKLLSN